MANDRVNVGPTTVHGRVATEPELNHTDQGKPVVSFRLAENKRYMDQKTGEWKDGAAEYYDVGITREQLAKNVLQSVKLGQKVNVEGKQVVRSFNTKDGQARVGRSIYATDVSPSLQLDSLQRGPSSEIDLSPEAKAEREAQAQAEADQTPAVSHGQNAQEAIAHHQTQNSGPVSQQTATVQAPLQGAVPAGPSAPSDVWQDPAYVQQQAQQTAQNFQQHEQPGPGQ